MIAKCDCKGNQYGTQGAQFQDQQYGKGNRVHTEGLKVLCCTVCRKEKTRSSGASVEKIEPKATTDEQKLKKSKS